MSRKFTESERTYEQAIALDPAAPGLQMGLGLVLTRKGDQKAALARMQKAVDMDPKNGAYRANIAQVYINLGDRNEARREAQKAIDLGFRAKHPAFDALGIKP
jgi:Flp pilus assembly protein TadD